ncbi:MAG: bifunctional phosphoglucose/phosphomannose isomerase [Bacillota bacterium]|jgi:glucose/mannose-6-phosphate isomerase
MVINLDDQNAITALDPGGMGKAISAFADQCRKARQIGKAAEIPDNYRDVDNIVVLGMGGSAIGGDLIRSLFEGELTKPFQVNRDYDIPAFVGPQTLVAACSYSGNTEETLSGYAEARRKGAKIIAFCTGGKLKELAEADGYPLVLIPGGLSPRAALGYSFHPIMAVLEKLGFLSPKDREFDEMLTVVEQIQVRMDVAVPETENFAKQLARKVFGKLPVIYGAGGWRTTVAARWKGQFNENAKNIAYWNAFPELNHNETVGWEAPAEVNVLAHVIILRDREEPPRLAKRVEVTRELMSSAVAGFTEIRAEGTSALARMFSLVYVGDFVSYYLSALNGIDPSPVRVIDKLKAELAKLG